MISESALPLATDAGYRAIASRRGHSASVGTRSRPQISIATFAAPRAAPLCRRRLRQPGGRRAPRGSRRPRWVRLYRHCRWSSLSGGLPAIMDRRTVGDGRGGSRQRPPGSGLKRGRRRLTAVLLSLPPWRRARSGLIERCTAVAARDTGSAARSGGGGRHRAVAHAGARAQCDDVTVAIKVSAVQPLSHAPDVAVGVVRRRSRPHHLYQPTITSSPISTSPWGGAYWQSRGRRALGRTAGPLGRGRGAVEMLQRLKTRGVGWRHFRRVLALDCFRHRLRIR